MNHKLRRFLLVVSVIALAIGGLVGIVPSATAVGSFSNGLIADRAETRTEGVWEGQCKAFVNKVVKEASGNAISLSGYQQGFANAGAVEVAPVNAIRGDIIQVTPAGSTDATAESLFNVSVSSRQLHTAIILTNDGGGNFWVIDSNSAGYPEQVHRHSYNPYSSASGSIIKIWRLGQSGGADQTGNQTPATSIIQRIATLSTNGSLSVKEGSISSPWVTVLSDVVQYAIAGDRIGVVTGDGVFHLKEGAITSPWVTMQADVSKIALTATRIGVVLTDGTVQVKEGSIGSPWVTIYGSTASIALDGNRIGIVDTGGTFYLKEGSISSPWITMQGSVSKISLAGTRIGVVLTDGTVQVKEGSISSPWVTVYGSSTDVVLAGDRIGVLETSGTFYLKQGSISSPWITMQGSVTNITMSGNRVGAVLSNGSADVKEGSVGDPWVTVNGAVSTMALSG